jgi:hypothetical protein
VVQSKLSTAAAAFLGDIPQNVNFAIRGSVVRSFLDSRGVEYENRSSIQPLSPTAIGETAGKSVVLGKPGDSPRETWGQPACFR